MEKERDGWREERERYTHRYITYALYKTDFHIKLTLWNRFTKSFINY